MAIVFIGKDPASDGYACLWLDSTGGGGLDGQAFGHAKAGTDVIAFLFRYRDTVFHTTFVFNRAADTWKWVMDNEENGKTRPFARVDLSRK